MCIVFICSLFNNAATSVCDVMLNVELVNDEMEGCEGIRSRFK